MKILKFVQHYSSVILVAYQAEGHNQRPGIGYPDTENPDTLKPWATAKTTGKQ